MAMTAQERDKRAAEIVEEIALLEKRRLKLVEGCQQLMFRIRLADMRLAFLRDQLKILGLTLIPAITASILVYEHVLRQLILYMRISA